MTSAEWGRINELFHQVLADWKAGEELLAVETPEIRAEVERMVSAHEALEGKSVGAAPRCDHILAGRYRLERLLGSGGSGEAWLSADLDRHCRRVVVKVPHHWAWFRADLKRRFEEEAALLRRVAHPAIVSVLDAGETEEGAPFLVMPYIAGEPLRTVLDRGPLPPDMAAAIAEQLGSAVQAAHEGHVIHRDIKPENVIVHGGAGGTRISLIDFGIAMFSEANEHSSTTTRFFGTTQYMAPEQLLAQPVSESDIYAMALLIFEMATGQPLFPAMTPAALYEAQRKLGEKDLSGVPGGLRRVLMRALHPNPRKRPANAAQFGRDAAERLLHPGPTWMPTRRAVVTGAAIAAGAGAWGVWSYRPVLATERRVDYAGGQTFRAVGWSSYGRIDSDQVQMNAEHTAYIGNRVLSRQQGGYWYPLPAAVQRRAFENGWRIRALLAPMHGFVGVVVTLGTAGVRYSCELVAPDRGGTRAQVVYEILPAVKAISVPIEFKGTLIPVEMRFDPRKKTVAALVGGQVVSTAYQGCRQFLDFPGIGLAVGQMESEYGEGVLGDLHLEID